jgi:methyltransferase
MIAYWIIAAVALQRLAELIWAEHNTQRLMALGGYEVGRTQYKYLVLLHASWLAAMVIFLPRPVEIHDVPLAAFVLIQLARFWVLLSLGPYYTTRIITLPGAPLVRSGPYRLMRHPNYTVVACEILLLPLAFGQVAVALVFAPLNLLLLAWRIDLEEAALAPRR